MSVDSSTVKRVARLSRIRLNEAEIEPLAGELNAMLTFVDQLSGVDVAGVEAMTSVIPIALKKRADIVETGGEAKKVTANAPLSEDHFFLVPKVVE